MERRVPRSMSSVELMSFADDGALARAAAEQWVKQLETAAQGSVPYCVALSGGRIAGRFFSAFAELANASRLRLSSVHFFWGDERCVSSEDPASNFGLAAKLLLRPLRIPDNQVHRVRGEMPPESAAAQAEAELRRVAPADAGGQPALDLIFLGMGEDGHVASLFPGEAEEVMADKAVYRPVTAPKPPPRRITLGYPAIAAARQAWVLASGAGKENALRESLASGVLVKEDHRLPFVEFRAETPLARVLRLRRQTKVLTDIAK